MQQPGTSATFDIGSSLKLTKPGLIKPKYHLQKAMMKAVDAAIFDANIILFMTEASDVLSQEDEENLQRFIETQKPVFVLLNKIDLINKNSVLPLIKYLSQNFEVTEIFPISALKKDGLDEVVEEIVRYLPQSPPYYPVDMLTEHPERFLVSEIIREKIFYHYGDEVPYSTTVIIEEWSERKNKKDFLRATIITEKESQR